MGRPGHVMGTTAVLAAALVGLGACGGGDTSKADSGSATALPSATDPASPRSSQKAPDQFIEQENPQRFIARWAAAEADMENTGKTDAYLALSRDCQACRQLAHTVSQYYAAGGFVHGGAWRIDSIKRSAPVNGMETYTVRAHTTPEQVRESSTRQVDFVPPTGVTYSISLVARGSSYSVALRTKQA